jgi:hypothetical protein
MKSYDKVSMVAHVWMILNTHMYESGGKHDACSELLQDDEDDALLRHPGERSRKNGHVNSDSAGHEDHKYEANTQRYVVLAI